MMFSINLEDVDDGRNVVRILRMKRIVSTLGESRNLLPRLFCFFGNQVSKLLKLQSSLGSKLL